MKCVQDIKYDIMDKIGKDLVTGGLFLYGPTRDTLSFTEDREDIIRAFSDKINEDYEEEITKVQKEGNSFILFIEPSDKLAEKYLQLYKNSNSQEESQPFNLEQIERAYNIDNTGPNTDRFINLAPAEKEEGVFSKYVQMKERLIRLLNNRLNQINKELRNTKLSVDERTKLNDLKQSIKTRLEGDLHRGIKGLVQEVLELNKEKNINAVGYYVEQDLARLAGVVNSNNASDLKEAQEIINFYDSAGTFQIRQENPFFEQDEIFFEGTSDYKLPPSLMEQFKEWRDRALKFQPTLDLRERELVTNTFNADQGVKNVYKDKQFNYNAIVHTDEGLKDLDWVSAWAMDVTQAIFSKAAPLAQVMHTTLINSLERNLNWSRDYAKRMEEMSEKVNRRLGEIDGGKYKLRAFGIIGVNGVSYDLFLDRTANGMETGTLVQRYSNNFINERSKANNNFRTEFEKARLSEVSDQAKANLFNRAFVNLKVWKRANTMMMNPALVPELISNPDFKEFKTKATQQEIDDHVKELKALLGERGYTEQVNIQSEMLYKYLADKQSYISAQMIHESVNKESDLTEQSKYAIKQWDNQHNPTIGVQDYWSSEGIYLDGRKINSFMDYNNTIPRKNKVAVSTPPGKGNIVIQDTTTETGYYNKDFATIEGDDVLRDFYDLVKEGVDRIRDVAPYELQRSMAANSLPALMKSTAEFLLDNNNNTLSMLSSAWRRLMERIRLSFGLIKQSEISYAVKDPITGKYNYKVNDQFLQGNQQAIKDREKLERFKMENLIGGNIRRFTVLPFKSISPEAMAQLAILLNVDITVQEIEAGKTDKIRNLTGDNVEIGKIIKDYATHTVVQSQSFDLPKLMKHFTNLAMAYASRTEALPIMEIMKKHYEGIKAPKTTNVGRAIFNVPEDTIASEGTRTQAIKQMEDWFQRVMLDNYGIKHWGEFGLANKMVKDKETNQMVTKVPKIFSRTIYSDEELKKLKEIDRLIATTSDEEKLKELNEMKDKLGKTRTVSAAVVNFLSGVRTIGLGWNIGSALTNLMEGYTSNMIIGASGEFFDPEQIYYGYAVAREGWTKNLTFGLRTTPRARLGRILMDRYNILVDNKNDLQKATTKTNLSRLEALNPHELSSRVEYYNQIPIMVAMLRTIKIKDSAGEESSVWDAMNTNDGTLKAEFRSEENVNNWEKLTGKEYLEFKNKVGEAITKGHGNYDELRGMMAKSNLAGKALLMFKTWLPAQLYWRFANEQVNLKTGAKVKGRYRSFTPGSAAVFGMGVGAVTFGPVGIAVAGGLGYLGGKFFGIQTELGALKEMSMMSLALAKKALGMPVNIIAGRNLIDNKNDFENWVGSGNFTEIDAKNLRGNVSELAITMTTLALMLLAKGFFYDDDDDKESAERKFHNFAVNKLLQLSSQATMYVNPVDMWKNTFGSIGIVTFLTNVGKEIDKMAKWIGGHDPGGQKFLEHSVKFVPGVFKGVVQGDPLNLGLSSQTEKQFTPTRYDEWFWSAEHKAAVHDKEQRAVRLEELKSLGYSDSQRKKIVNIEFPTTKQLNKKGLTREEWDALHTDYVRPEVTEEEQKK